MRGKIPDHVHVVLKKAEINSRRIVVIQISESAVTNELPHFPYRTGEEECMIDHDLEFSCRGKFDQLLGLFCCGCKGLFDKDMLPMLERFTRQLKVRPYRGDNS